MKMTDVLWQLTEDLRESHRRFDEEVAELMSTADRITRDCDQLIRETE